MRNLFQTDLWRDLYAKHRGKLVATQVVATFLIGFIVAWAVLGPGDWRLRVDRTDLSQVDRPGASQADDGPTQYTCSMHPQIRRSGPGKCPLCGMTLVPVERSSGGMRTLAVTPQAKALMSIQTAPVERKYVTNRIEMVGKVDYDETSLGYITAWVPGRLDRLYVDYTGVEVKQGDHMLEIYSEELYSAQEELIQALKYRRPQTSPTTKLIRPVDLVESAREKLRLLGLTADQIQEIEQRRQPTDHVTINSPVGGIVIYKHRQQGDRVQTGDRIYTIADLTKVWVHLDAYESDLPWIKYGQQISITTEAYPGERFTGSIVFVQPVLHEATRTVKVRVNVANPDGKLKPGMFVHGSLDSQVASGGRVMDAKLVGKWISPMHPEIVKDAPGVCDICGMPLVPAETLGFVAADNGEKAKPLVIPYSAAMRTGRRAVVYVELPSMHSGVEMAFQAVFDATKEADVEKMRQAYTALGNVLEAPYDQPGTAYARRLWNEFADRLSEYALAGQRVQSVAEAEPVFKQLEATTNELREQFAPPEQPTFEGREIVLGPRAGDYYLVRRGLQDGELVVTQGSFKIDAEVQIQAKPSMMTPEGGGAAGHAHAHGNTTARKTGGQPHADHGTLLPAEFHDQLAELDAAYDVVTNAMRMRETGNIGEAYADLGQALDAVDGSSLTGHPRMVWKEFAMLLGNDVEEGRDTSQASEADRVYLLLKGHMRRMREQLDVPHAVRPRQQIEVTAEFQAQLARLWQDYLPISQALSGDNLPQSRQSVVAFAAALAVVKSDALSQFAASVWTGEHAKLTKAASDMQAAEDIESLRTTFSQLSDEMRVLIERFGLGDVGPVYQLHCPMALDQQGAIWFQNNDQTRNPYFGATMLTCADRVQQIAPREEPQQQDEHQGHDHSGHQIKP